MRAPVFVVARQRKKVLTVSEVRQKSVGYN